MHINQHTNRQKLHRRDLLHIHQSKDLVVPALARKDDEHLKDEVHLLAEAWIELVRLREPVLDLT